MTSPHKSSAEILVTPGTGDVRERKRAEEALKKSLATSEQALKELADQKFALDQHAIVAVTDVQGTITYVNEKFCAISQYSNDELIGQNHRILNSGHHSREFFLQMYHTIANGQVWRCEICNRAKDGSIYWVDTTIVPLLDTGGKPRQYMAIRADITERKRVEAALAEQTAELSQQAEEALETQKLMLQSVLDSMGEGLVAADREGHFIIWNDSATKLMGREASDLPTEQWTPHYKVFLPDGITPYPSDRLPLVRALHGESVQVELMIEHPERANGVFLEVTARPLKDNQGNLGGGVAVLRDITERKAAERKIQELNQNLEARVIERTAELKAANKELEAFTYSVSHDLRSPIRHISGFTKILVEKFRSSLPAEAQQHLQLIEQAAGRMGQMVDEMLKLARLGRQALAVEVTGLSSLVEDVVTLLAPETEGRQVEWKIDELPFAECDPVLTRQVFQNLIGNALKYSRPRSPAVIEIGQMEKEGKKAIFVKDNGVGFDMKYMDKLFGVFQRLHTAEEFEGTGIGLATVERIVQKHGGRVWVEAELDRGATFYFTLGDREHSVPEKAAAAAGGSL